MTKLDIFILIVFVVSVAWGFRKGVIVQAGALGGLILGVLLCHIGGDYIAAMIASKGADAATQPGYVDKVMANIILFIIGYLSVRIVAHFFKTVVRSLSLGVLDRIAGALFSCFEWMLALSILLNLWLLVKPATPFLAMSTIGNGHAIEAILSLAPALLGWAVGG